MKEAISKQEELFASECKVINLKREYRDYTGKKTFAIVSDLTDEELLSKYPDVVIQFLPFVHLTYAHWKVFCKYHCNEGKFKKRAIRTYEFYGYEEGLSECFCSALVYGYEDPVQRMMREECELEAACEFAITSGIKKPRCHHLNSILASNQDEIYVERKKADAKDHSQMGYLRGSSYYGGGRDDQ